MTRSKDEIRAEHISVMGNELGACFYELDRKLIELHILWQQYLQLFDTAETVHLLNRNAGLFFKIVQDELWDSVLLGISRMTDPPVSKGKKNLTLLLLPSLLKEPALRFEIQDLCDKAVRETMFAREHRNKRIAHQDHDYLKNPNANPLSGISRKHIESMLASLRIVLNRLNQHFRDSTMMYEVFVDQSGARVLVNKLQKLERFQTPEASC